MYRMIRRGGGSSKGDNSSGGNGGSGCNRGGGWTISASAKG